jgi:hypothetical protein
LLNADSCASARERKGRLKYAGAAFSSVERWDVQMGMQIVEELPAPVFHPAWWTDVGVSTRLVVKVGIIFLNVNRIRAFVSLRVAMPLEGDNQSD